MFLWFIGTAVLTVAYVFRDPTFDYRLLIVGSVLPLADAVTGGPGVLHTLVLSLVLMVVVMLSSVGRRPVRKLLARTADRDDAAPRVRRCLGDHRAVLVAARRVVVRGARAARGVARAGSNVAFELAGLVMVVWIWRRSHLSDPAARRAFVQHGRLFT